MSLGVAMPGPKENPASRAAASSRGLHPGETPKAAPAPRAACNWSTVRIVPIPAVISGTSRRMARNASSAAGVRRVNSITSIPPASNARAKGVASLASSTTSTATTPAAEILSAKV